MVSVADGARGYLQYLVVERGLAANTVESYRRDLNRYAEVLAALGKTELGDVTAVDVAEFRAALHTGDDDHPPLATSSVGRAVVAVRGLHAFARAQGMTVDDPAREVAPPSPPRRLPKAITVDEIERLLDAAGSTDDPDPRVLRDRALLEFLYGTGARISEVTGLDVDDLDHLARDPAVRLTGKGGKQRFVPVGSYAVRALDAYLVRGRPALAAAAVRRSSPAVFLNARGGRAHPAGRVGSATRSRGPFGETRCFTPHPAALLRHPPPRRGRRHPGRPGIARTRLRHHDAGLHSDNGGQASRGVRRRASARSGGLEALPGAVE